MVCISCFIAPVLLFVWYHFIYPFLQPLVNRLFGGYQLPQPFANLTCPLPQKKPKDDKQVDTNTGDGGDGQTCPAAAAKTSEVTTEETKKEL